MSNINKPSNSKNKPSNSINKPSNSNINNEDLKFLKLQIEDSNIKYKQLLKQKNFADERYKQIVHELDNLYNLVGDNTSNTLNICNTSNSCKKCLVFDEPGKCYTHTVECDAQYIFITMVGGGGAGGVGHVVGSYYYSGGGGGGSACIVNKPVKVGCGYILNIYVGVGGSQNPFQEATTSTIEIVSPYGDTVCVSAAAGSNAYPTMCCEQNVCGGDGGSSGTETTEFNNINNNIINNTNLINVANGNNGQNGVTSIPSQMSAYGGKGGSTMLYTGGAGGGTYFASGGTGGNSVVLIGQDGQYGSGGGGSAPKSTVNKTEKVSGNGGDGVIIVQFC